MVIDSSALIAIAFEEPAANRVLNRINQASSPILPSPCFFESATVLTRTELDPEVWLLQMIGRFSITVTPFTMEQGSVALEAYVRYGKGRHPAGLNFGDCMAYAVAKVAGLPLLYVGDDFSKTDIESA